MILYQRHNTINPHVRSADSEYEFHKAGARKDEEPSARISISNFPFQFASQIAFHYSTLEPVHSPVLYTVVQYSTTVAS